MAEFPALPLWTDAYLGDTTHLDATEHGAYLLLLIVSWRSKDCRIPDDDVLLAKYSRCSGKIWKRVRPVLEPFFVINDGCWTQLRLLDEKQLVSQRRESAAANGRLSALKRKGRHSTERPTERPTDAQQTVNEIPTTTPTPTPTHIEDKPLHGGRASRLPADFAPVLTPSARSTTSAWPAGMLERELAQFKDNAAAKGLTYKDWQAAFRTWISNAEKWKARGNGRNDRSQSGHGVTIDAAQDWINGR